MNWQRARTEKKKSERKNAIYEAAVTLFNKNGYENVSLNGIASEAGFTKSNMYRYFDSREEIFLNIFSDLFIGWSSDCQKNLKRLQQNESVERFARVWVKSLMPHCKFLDLSPILFVSLEKNSSFDQLLEFKRLAMRLLGEISSEISRIYPDLVGENAFRLLSLAHGATSSYWAVSSYNEALETIYKRKEFEALKPNFERDLKAAIEVFVLGLKQRHKMLKSKTK